MHIVLAKNRPRPWFRSACSCVKCFSRERVKPPARGQGERGKNGGGGSKCRRSGSKMMVQRERREVRLIFGGHEGTHLCTGGRAVPRNSRNSSLYRVWERAKFLDLSPLSLVREAWRLCSKRQGEAWQKKVFASTIILRVEGPPNSSRA